MVDEERTEVSCPSTRGGRVSVLCAKAAVFCRFNDPELLQTCAETELDCPEVLVLDNVPEGSSTLSPSEVEIKQFGGIMYDWPFHLRFTDLVRLSFDVKEGGNVIN